MAAKIATVIGEYEKTCGVFVETERGKCTLSQHDPRGRGEQLLAAGEPSGRHLARLPRLSEGSLGGEAYSLAKPTRSPCIGTSAIRSGWNLNECGCFLKAGTDGDRVRLKDTTSRSTL